MSHNKRAKVKENWDSVPPYLPQLMNLPKTFTVTCTMKERAIPQFLALLKYMEYLGHIGSTRQIAFFCDGDGDFRPKFIWGDHLPKPDKYLKQTIIDHGPPDWLDSVYEPPTE